MKGIHLSQFQSLSRFCEEIRAWPETATDKDLVAQRIATYLQVPVVAFFSSWNQEVETGRMPSRSNSFQESGGFQVGLRYPLREEVQSRDPQIRQSLVVLLKKLIPNSHDPAQGYWTSDLPQSEVQGALARTLSGVHSITGSHLIVPLIHPGPGMTTQSTKYLGALLIGSESPLNADQEALFQVVVRYLSYLGQIAFLNTGIQIRNQFLSIASHELKTPLTSIYGVLQLQERMIRLRKDQTPFPEQERHHHFLKMVIQQVERLNELIDGFLDVSRIQSGRFHVEPSETDVPTLLRDCIQSRLIMISAEAGVKIQLEAPEHLIAKVDPVRLEEVISNLIMNAIRFSPEGGVIWVRLKEDGEAFRLTVRDQGPSISAEDRERIFQPFEKVQRTSRMGGLGLGLFISRQIAILHGGNVSLIESVPGKGNVMEAYFPTHMQQAMAPSA